MEEALDLSLDRILNEWMNESNYPSCLSYFMLASSRFMKIRPVVAELFHANGQPDTTKLIAAFRNFEKWSKNVSNKYYTLRFTSFTPMFTQNSNVAEYDDIKLK